MMARSALTALVLVAACVAAPQAQSDQANRERARREVQGSLNQSSDQTLSEKLASGICGAHAAAATIGVLIGASSKVIASVFSMTESDLAEEAAQFACHRRNADAGVSDQAAIRFMQIAQCHNTGAVEFIQRNQGYVRDALGEHGKCRRPSPQ